MNNAVLSPTLADAIAAVQYYWLLIQTAKLTIDSETRQANTAAAQALQAEAAVLSLAASISAQASSLSLTLIANGSTTVQTSSRIRRALQNLGLLQMVDDYVMNNYDVTSDTAIEWHSSPFLLVNGFVYIMIRAAIPYTDVQARALWHSASLLSE
jgi:hypothetical protein